jgi:mono/diheme cytochrome c family protein
MKNHIVVVAALAAFVTIPLLFAAEAKKGPKMTAQIKQGEHLVKSIGCADCHTPKKMGPNGPEDDNTRFLSGHPASNVVPPPPKLPAGPWMIMAEGGLTAWSGPWGVSFTRNLTPDKETGLGDWTEQNFIDTLRTGKKMGKGRGLLPPMPWQAFSNLSDDELKAIFAYLKSIPPIKNAVPEPIPPAAP